MFKREQLHPGVHFSCVRDEKFRHNSISINLITPLRADRAAHTALIPSLLRKGCRSLPDFTLLEQRLCELYGASLSSDIIKVGSCHIISCGITFVDDGYTLGGEVISDKCAALLGDMVLQPKIQDGAFDQADFDLERQNLIDTIEAEINDKRSYALSQCRAMLFAGSQLATPRYGTIAAAQAQDPHEVADWYTQLLDTAAIEILMIGCGDPAPAREHFRGLFGGMSPRPAATMAAQLPPWRGQVEERTKVIDVAQSKLVLGLRTGPLPTKQQVDAMKLMSFLYGGTPSSRLFLNVREKLSLCYYCAARMDRATTTLLVDIGVEHQNAGKAREAILAQLAELAAGSFSQQEIDETKLAVANSLRSANDSLSGLESWYLMQILQGTALSPEEEVADMNAVTHQQMQQAAAAVTLDSVYFLTGKEAESHE